jgi:hypothetical protein
MKPGNGPSGPKYAVYLQQKISYTINTVVFEGKLLICQLTLRFTAIIFDKTSHLVTHCFLVSEVSQRFASSIFRGGNRGILRA